MQAGDTGGLQAQKGPKARRWPMEALNSAPEDENIQNKHINDIAFTYFKKYKVEISGAITTTFPFLELIRDRGFITNEMYEKSQESFKKRFSVHEVIYDILSELEKKFDMSVLRALFSNIIINKYPDLLRIYKIFYKVIPDIKSFLESDKEENEERLNNQLSLEQGTGGNSYQRPIWLGPDATNYNGTALPEHGLSEHCCETQEINVNETSTTTDNNNALENQQGNEKCAQESEQEGAELLHHGNKTSSCSLDLVDIKKKMPFLYSGVECEAQARTGCNQASISIEINSEDSRESSDGGEPPEASTSALKREPGTVDFGNNSISEKVKKRRRTKMRTDETVDFKAEILPLTCGVMVGMLIKRKLKRGATVKCIRREDGNWFTPREFEVAGGYEKSSNWKNSVCCGGRTLKWMIQQGYLLKPPRGVKKKLKKAEKCKICGDEGKLFNCSWCFSFFHGDCHIPPVDSKRNNWKCTFCKIKMSSRSQQQASESEVLARPMRPEEKMKCEFLLLKAYCHFEGNVFPNIPHENYVQKASQCLETLRRLDEIKNSLNDGCYAQVEGFVLDMNNIYQDPKHNDSDLTEEEFKKNFKKVFAIQ
ncbi:nuclear body protein SP140-like protein isoform X1 [Myotis daubentonii]|uniref:nuclear body protein SP140-like protein isoform X1 n=1 Tax=Myotis daubentonii TaxID=98922 RepID=UPI0028736D02|nr:nuclear body protein SP140-like protein isoform X1 [Myotis daubentonii]